jgi:hypothetical protein
MKKLFYKITTLLSLTLLPIKSFALEYQPLESGAFEMFGGANKAGDLNTFLSQAFQFGLALAAALAVVMIVWGGVEIMLSESVFKKEDGKKKIEDAIWGLLLALVSWLILYTINPDILNFRL